MSTLYRLNEVVLLAANPYHLGIVRADQAGSYGDVLVEWLNTPPVHMLPHEIVRESTYHELHPGPYHYDIFEPMEDEKP